MTPEKFISLNLKKNKKTISVLSALTVLASVISVLVAVAAKNVLDSAMGQSGNTLLSSVIQVGILLISQLAVQILLSYISVKAENKTVLREKRNLYGEILNTDYSQIEKFHTGDLISRINSDTYIVFDGIIDIIPSAVSFFSQIIFSFAALFRYDALYALFYLLSIPVIFFFSRLFKNKIKILNINYMKSESRIREEMQENLGNVVAVKAFQKEDFKKNSLKVLQKRNYWCIIKKAKIGIGLNIAFYMLLTLGYCITVIWGAYRVSSGFYTLGTLVAVIELVSMIQSPLRSVSSILPQYFAMLASAERILELKRLSKDGDSEASADETSVKENFESLKFDSVSFSYEGSKVIDSLSFGINKGEFVLVTGKSGIGKSTLMKLILGIEIPNSGSIRIISGDRQYYAGKNTRCLFSYVPQGNMIFSGTVKENILFGEPFDKEKYGAAVKTACAEDFINELPQGSDTPLMEYGSSLSEGQRQRIAIARAVYRGGEVFLLDEPTSALDGHTEKKVLENLKLLGKTVIMISHNDGAEVIAGKKIKM